MLALLLMSAFSPPSSFPQSVTDVGHVNNQASPACRINDKQLDAWINRNRQPIGSLEPVDDDADLSSLRVMLSRADIVGLGEASHGSHEIFQIKDRVVRYLVRRLNFRTLFFELDLVTGRRLDDYIHHRTSKIDVTLKPWDTQEVLAMLDWLRSFNRGRKSADQVSIVGFDGQDRVSGANQLLSYLGRVAPERVAAASDLFETKDFPLKIEPTRRDELQRRYAELLSWMYLDGARMIVRSSEDDYQAMLSLARVMAETGSIYDNSDTSQQQLRRDAYMAENLRKAINALPTGSRSIVWAHNGHINTSPQREGTGRLLRSLYGQRYYALGVDFGSGRYQVWTLDKPIGLVDAVAPLPTPNSVEQKLLSAAPGSFLLNFRNERDTAAACWLEMPHDIRSLGAQTGRSIWYGPTMSLRDAYDGLIFVPTSTRALPSARMRAAYPETTLR